VVVDKKTRKVICTSYAQGKKHDFRLLKESHVKIASHKTVVVDTGYQGLQKIHINTKIPTKKSRNRPLSKAVKKANRAISSERVEHEHAIGFIKRFKIVADKYRNRRRRFGLRFNLIAGICNYEICS
jgi:hypothetical protein